MKPGDTLLCKKQLELFPHYFTINQFYVIERLDNKIDNWKSKTGYQVVNLQRIAIRIRKNDKESTFVMSQVRNSKLISPSLKGSKHWISTVEYVWDYFYTTQELRKLKLENVEKRG